MELITRKTLAKSAPGRWRRQYFGSKDHDKVEITRQLDALEAFGFDIDPNAVDTIIGNKSWTEVPVCDECKRKAHAVVCIGDEPDYESATAHICINCARRSVAELSVEASS